MSAETARQASQANEQNTDALLDLVRQLVLELHPQRQHSLGVTLDSALDRELGFDSLSRVELLMRIERFFGVSLPENLLANAETPRDLLRAVQSARSACGREVTESFQFVSPDEAEGVPVTARTLPEMLDWHVQRHPQRTHVYLYAGDETPEAISYGALRDGARRIATGLVQRGLETGQTVAIMLPTGRDYLHSFYGVLLAGGVPVPIYPPVRLSQIEDHLRRHAAILANAQVAMLITVSEARKVARLLSAQVETLRQLVTPDELAVEGQEFKGPAVHGGDIAFLQYTSGSTGQPKGVILTHDNLLANIRAMGEAVEAQSTDVFVSWLPLYHDMGLIGAWLGSLYFSMPLVLMSPLAFLTSPKRWLWAIHHHRGSLSAAPNFAYALCLAKLQESDLEGLDLGCWRRAFNGAEPVSPHTVRNFCQRFAPYGLRNEAMAPVYGLAEAAVGLAFPPPERGPLIDRIQREPLASTGKALPAAKDDPHALEIVACGQPLPGYQIRIVDDAGHELPERQEGRLEFRGPSATSGYLRNPQATRKLFDGDWLDSGDLAYIAAGDVYLTSRSKDIIIRAGRNIYPYEVEEAVGDLPGIRKGCVAVFGSTQTAGGTEKLIIIAESRETGAARLQALQQQVYSTATDVLGMPPDEVVLAPPHTVLKTSSGKIRRAAMRQLYEQGRLGQRSRAVWWQFGRLFLSALGPWLNNRWHRIRRTGYAVYAQLIFWLLAPPAWLLVALLPRRRWRWQVMRSASRLFFRLTRIPLQVEGLEQLTGHSSCVFVANHASYLDGIVLVAALPREFSFVAKSELSRQFIPRVFLERIGAEFVERFDKQQGVADARHISQMAQTGRSMLFFPEGTFTRSPGLLPFHMGAFVSAAEADLPVVPVTIRGTRSILRGNSRFAHRGAVHVLIGKPLTPQGRDWAAAVELARASRREILRHLGEPDLAQGQAGIPPVNNDSHASDDPV